MWACKSLSKLDGLNNVLSGICRILMGLFWATARGTVELGPTLFVVRLYTRHYGKTRQRESDCVFHLVLQRFAFPGENTHRTATSECKHLTGLFTSLKRLHNKRSSLHLTPTVCSKDDMNAPVLCYCFYSDSTFTATSIADALHTVI